VNGRAPDGKDDCTDGKNDVTVVVKNAGAADAESFVVRLDVDDDQGGAEEKSVSGLDAGKEREVHFDDVGLKKGERKLAVTVDAKSSVAESDEGNNQRTVTARCTDDD
jgi:subtilase family serine protease